MESHFSSFLKALHICSLYWNCFYKWNCSLFSTVQLHLIKSYIFISTYKYLLLLQMLFIYLKMTVTKEVKFIIKLRTGNACYIQFRNSVSSPDSKNLKMTIHKTIILLLTIWQKFLMICGRLKQFYSWCNKNGSILKMNLW